VAVIDSGIYAARPDLATRLSGAINECTTPSLLGGCEGTGVDDDEGHGTHVAGLACATSDNRYGIASIGFGCLIYAIKSDLTYTSIVTSIHAAVAHGADAINMSFGGGGPSSEMEAALNYAWANGSVPVAAGDNSPNPSPANNYPAEYVRPEDSGPTIDAGEGLVVTSASHSGLRSNRLIKLTASGCGRYGSGLGWGIIRSDRALAALTQKDILAPSSRVRSARVGHVPGRGRVAELRLKRSDRSQTPCTKEIPSSGLKSVAVFASANGGAYHRIAKTRKGRVRFGAKPGRRYRFFSVAVDKAGNREPTPGVPDAKLRLRRHRR
jgi:subtilisin family serine protease